MIDLSHVFKNVNQFLSLYQIIFLQRYFESGVYTGMTEEKLVPRLKVHLDVTDDKILLYPVYTESDIKVHRQKLSSRISSTGETQ